MELQKWLDQHKITEDMFDQRFIIDTKLSKGASSQVYQARDTRVSNNVRAIRVSHATGNENGRSREELLTRFKSETEIMQALQGSPYVVKLFETFATNASVTHVMELAEGGSLRNYIPWWGMPSDRALACMQQIFSGLAFVHSQNIIHYDVKPGNVLVFGNGRLKLTDFDISLRVINRDVVCTTDGEYVRVYPISGTRPYVAPESLNEAMINADDVFKVDIFSAGMTFLKLLTNSGLGDADALRKKMESKQSYVEALHVEEANRKGVQRNTRKKMGKLCNRCKKLFKYTLRTIQERKSAAEIVQAMRTWTLRPRQFGFDDAKSKSIVANMAYGTILDMWIGRHKMKRDQFSKRFPEGTKLGEGTTSRVYATMYKGNARAVRVSHAKNRMLLQKFKTETEILQKLEGSPHVVTLYETRVLDNWQYHDVCHVMELADAGDLFDYIPMSATQALACVQQIFRGLAFIHSRGIVH